MGAWLITNLILSVFKALWIVQKTKELNKNVISNSKGLTLLVKTGLEPATFASYSSNATVLDPIELAPIGVCTYIEEQSSKPQSISLVKSLVLQA